VTDALVIAPLDESRLSRAGEALALAFANDPMWHYIEPDDTRRRRAQQWAMPVMLRYAMLFGEAHGVASPSSDTSGAAAWLPPTLTYDPDPDGTRSGFADAKARIGAEAWARWSDYGAHLDVLRKQQPAHWYLMLLGVDPAMQRRGIASALLAPQLERAEADGVPCYLETERAENVKFYGAHGFEIAIEGEFRGLRYWTMKRPARA
jgi:ribosomal protein S18 acetylase RimI-like enzyme